MLKTEVEIEIPEGWERIQIGKTKPGDRFLTWMFVDGDCEYNTADYNCLIRRIAENENAEN